MATTTQLYGKSMDHYPQQGSWNHASTNNNYNVDQSIVTNRTPPSDIRKDFSKIQQIPTDRKRGASLPCSPSVLIGALVLLLIAAAFIVPLAIILTIRTTSSSTLSTSTTTINPCEYGWTSSNGKFDSVFSGVSGNLRWNTTGITVLSAPTLSYTSGLFFDSYDTLFIADETGNHVIWKLSQGSSTPIRMAGLYQSAGSNASQLYNPQDVYVDSNQNICVVDCNNHRVQKFPNGSPNGVTIAGITASSGSAVNQLTNPRYFTFDSTETYFYLADFGNHRIMRYATNSISGTNGTVVAGGNGAGNTNNQLNGPWGVHYPSTVSTFLYITNSGGHTVMQWAPGASSGTVIAGRPGLAGSNATLLNTPMGIKVDRYLNMYVVDSGNNRVQMFCQNNQTGITIAGDGTQGSSATQFHGPRGIAFDSQMNLYIGDLYNSRVQKFLKL